MTSRLQRLAPHLPLLIALALLLPWGLWAIAVDDLPGLVADSFTLRALNLARGTPEALIVGDKIMPLPILVAGLLAALLGKTLFALRLGGVICYAVLMWQSYDLARRCEASRWTAGLAALLCGTTPLIIGWSRMEYSDIFVAVFSMGCLQVMCRGRLDRGRAVLLGALGGLGLLTKLGFPAYIVAPALWFAAAHLRRRRHLLNLLLALGVAAVVVGWWFALRGGVAFENLLDSTQSWRDVSRYQRDPMVTKLIQLRMYLWLVPGLPGLWLGAAGGLLLWRKRGPRLPMTVLGLGSLLTLAVLFLFDESVRYLCPLAPPCAVATALGVGRLAGALPRAWRLPAHGAAALAALGWFVYLNLVPSPMPLQRYHFIGILSPVTTYTETCHMLGRYRDRVTVVLGEPDLGEWLTGLPDEDYRRCRFLVAGPRPGARCRVRLVPGYPQPFAPLPASHRRICPDPAPLNAFSWQAGLNIEVEPL